MQTFGWMSQTCFERKKRIVCYSIYIKYKTDKTNLSFWGVTRRRRKFWGCWHVLLHELSADLMDEFILQKFIELFNYYRYAFQSLLYFDDSLKLFKIRLSTHHLLRHISILFPIVLSFPWISLILSPLLIFFHCSFFFSTIAA